VVSALADTGCDALGVDWTTDLADARRAVQDRVALQGNLDPSVLYAPPEQIRAQVARVLASLATATGTCSTSAMHPPRRAAGARAGDGRGGARVIAAIPRVTHGHQQDQHW